MIMPQRDPYGFEPLDHALLEAEVSPNAQAPFEQRYQQATGQAVSPGAPHDYQLQPNKWGAECRVYFNSHVVAMCLRSLGIHVEEGRPYRNTYRYRINVQDVWWELVENYGFRLGVN
jgi:NAD-dependent oxidoreductase involved in siderophore biosynthesis